MIPVRVKVLLHTEHYINTTLNVHNSQIMAVSKGHQIADKDSLVFSKVWLTSMHSESIKSNVSGVQWEL